MPVKYKIKQAPQPRPHEIEFELAMDEEGCLEILANGVLIAYIDPSRGVLELAKLLAPDIEQIGPGLEIEDGFIKEEK